MKIPSTKHTVSKSKQTNHPRYAKYSVTELRDMPRLASRRRQLSDATFLQQALAVYLQSRNGQQVKHSKDHDAVFANFRATGKCLYAMSDVAWRGAPTRRLPKGLRAIVTYGDEDGKLSRENKKEWLVRESEFEGFDSEAHDGYESEGDPTSENWNRKSTILAEDE